MAEQLRRTEAENEVEKETHHEAEKSALEGQLQRMLRDKRDSAEEASSLRDQLQALGAEAAVAHERKTAEIRALRASVDAAVADRGLVDEQCAALRADLAAAAALASRQDGELAEVRRQLDEAEKQRHAAQTGCEFATAALRHAQQELQELVRTIYCTYLHWHWFTWLLLCFRTCAHVLLIFSALTVILVPTAGEHAD